MTDFKKIKKLFEIDSPNGFSEKEINNLVNIYSTLPQVLLDYYKELGNYDFNYFQDFLIKPDEYQRYINHEYFIFCRENQGCYFWGIKKEDLFQKNPPVFCSEDKQNWKIECVDLCGYLHGFAYINAIFSLNYVVEEYIELDEKDINFIKNNFLNKNVRFNEWTMGIEFYGDYDDTILIIMGETSLFYSSNNKEHFIEMEKKLKAQGIK
jgi:hypothetical protein